jgi:hypothetical protein
LLELTPTCAEAAARLAALRCWRGGRHLTSPQRHPAQCATQRPAGVVSALCWARFYRCSFMTGPLPQLATTVSSALLCRGHHLVQLTGMRHTDGIKNDPPTLVSRSDVATSAYTLACWGCAHGTHTAMSSTHNAESLLQQLLTSTCCCAFSQCSCIGRCASPTKGPPDSQPCDYHVQRSADYAGLIHIL